MGTFDLDVKPFSPEGTTPINGIGLVTIKKDGIEKGPLVIKKQNDSGLEFIATSSLREFDDVKTLEVTSSEDDRYMLSELLPGWFAKTVENAVRDGTYNSNIAAQVIGNIAHMNFAPVTLTQCSDILPSRIDGEHSYSNEFLRRAERLNVSKKGQFVESILENYVRPIEQYDPVISSGDLHGGNVFTDGTLFDLEAVCIGTFGADFAKYLISTSNESCVNDILERRSEEVEMIVHQYNQRSQNTASKPEVEGMLRNHMIHAALTTGMQRIKDYASTSRDEFGAIAQRNLHLAYNSITEEERHLWKSELPIAEPISGFTEL